MGHYAKAYSLLSRIRGYRRFQYMLHSLRDFDKNEVAQQRMKIIKFYEEYGEKATVEAFGADRKVVSRWKKKLKEGGGRLLALIPESTRPHKKRTPDMPQEIVDYIKNIRLEHPKLGKEKIKQRNKLFYFQKIGRAYHDPNSKWAQNRVNKKKRLWVKQHPKPKYFGHIVADTITRITDGVKDYFYCAIDARLKFAITLNYKRLTSRNMKDFYQRFKQVYPGIITLWQTDNGGENLGEFSEELSRDNIPHFFSYPNCPKINSYVERYNRTIQEEFIDNHLDIIHDKPLFNQKLADYLIFYNTQRPHKSLGLKSPMDYLIENGEMSQMCLTYTRY